MIPAADKAYAKAWARAMQALRREVSEKLEKLMIQAHNIEMAEPGEFVQSRIIGTDEGWWYRAK